MKSRTNDDGKRFHRIEETQLFQFHINHRSKCSSKTESTTEKIRNEKIFNVRTYL
jgi:hypothetical protein